MIRFTKITNMYCSSDKVKTLYTFFILGALFIFAAKSQAAIYYANGSCSNNGDGTVSTCAASSGDIGATNTIQAAIDKAVSGDIVKIVPYSYLATSTTTVYTENLLINKEITLEADTSILPEPYYNQWIIIDGDANDDGLGDNGNATLSWSGGVCGTLQNLTITGGYSAVTGGMGAGLMISGEGTDVLVRNVSIRYNDNGIVVRNGAAPTIKSCFIYNHDRGGIIVRDGSSPVIGGSNCGLDPKTCNDSDANEIYRNSQSMTSTMCPAGGSVTSCDENRDHGCAAIAVIGASAPTIWGNKIYGNKYVGIVATELSAPSIKWNSIKLNGRTGVGLFSVGQGLEIKDNWIQQNERGIGIQSSGDPCNKVAIRDNSILGNSLGGIATCNAYVLIDGNKISNNKQDGIFLAFDSEAEISYNNIVNNFDSGIILFGSKGIIENNLISDNGKSQLTPHYGHIEVIGGTAEIINNNIIVGGKYVETAFEGVGILTRESGVFEYRPALLTEVKDNIIYRVGLGIQIMEDWGYGSINRYRPGAIDRNLVAGLANSILDTDGVMDGYLLGTGNKPGDQTYYYGQTTGSYGNPAAYFFQNPNHELSAVSPDFLLASDVNSPVYTISAYANAPLVDYLGLPADFNYIDDTSAYNYKFITSLAGLSPALDINAPIITKINPPDGGNLTQPDNITIYLQDTGDGIDENSVSLDLDGGVGAAGNCNDCPISLSGNSSYLKVLHMPFAVLDANTSYTLSISANDMRGNNLSATSIFNTVDSEDIIPPTVEELTPINGATGVAVDTPMQFTVKDSGSGVNPDSIILNVSGSPVTVQKTLSDPTGAVSDFFVYYRPETQFDPGQTVNLNIYAEDYASNFYNENKSFTTANDLTAPPDVTKLNAMIKGTGIVELSWLPSENIDCDIASYPYTLYTNNGYGYGSGENLLELLYNTDNYTITNLSDGIYDFKLTVKDVYGNTSAGAEVNNVQVTTNTEFRDDFEGFYDDFSADLGKWGSSGAASWTIVNGELQVSGAAGELTINNLNHQDYTYKGKINITSSGVNDAAWLLVRKAATSALGTSGYAAKIGLGGTNNVAVYELDETGMQLLEIVDSSIGSISSGTWYNVKLAVEGNSIKLYLGLDPNPADTLQLTAIDSDNSYSEGFVGLWQPEGNGNISYDDIEINYNKNGGEIYRYSISSPGWSHEDTTNDLTRNALKFEGTNNSELLINPLSLPEGFKFTTKFNIASGSFGLLAHKAIGSAVGSSGYLVQIAIGTTGNIKFYELPGNTPQTVGSYSIISDIDYWIWLIGRSNSYEVYLGNSDIFADSTKVFEASDSDATYTTENIAGFYAEASSQIVLDDVMISADLGETGRYTEIVPGTGYADIQVAIDAAVPGDSLIFSAGIYDIGTNTINMKNGVSIKAATINPCGTKTVTIKGTNVLTTAANNASIEGLRFEGNGSNTGILVMDASTDIINNEIVSCYDGMRISNTPQYFSAPTVQDNCIHNNSKNGISNSAESSANIADNHIYDNNLNGIGNNGSAIPNITGNLIYGNGAAGIGNRENSKAIIGQNNQIYDNGGHGIAVIDSAEPRIENNKIYANQESGIGIGCPVDEPACIADASPIIENNAIYSNLYAGISMRSQVKPYILGNEIYNHIYTCMGVNCIDSENSYGAGIRLSEFAKPGLGTNNIHDNSYGIAFDLDAANQMTISNLSVSKNGIGLHIGGNSAVTVENCILFSNYKLGIGMFGNAHPTIQNNEVRHNGDAAGREGDYLRYMSEAGTGVGGIGMGLNSYPTIQNNIIWGHQAEIAIQDDTLDTQSGLPPDQVRLGATASSVDNYYKGRSIYLLDGLGLPRIVLITSYDGSTKIATLSSNYDTKPQQGDRYRIFRENFGIGVRGNTRTEPNVPMIYDNVLYSNFLAVAVGSRDDSGMAPNPEIYNNNIYDNGTGDCPDNVPGLSCGGGIGNTATSSANIHHNEIYNNKFGSNNFGIGVRENANPTIHSNQLYSNTFGIGMYIAPSDVIITSNTISYNLECGIAMYNTGGIISADNLIFENGNLYTSPSSSGQEACPDCDPVGIYASASSLSRDGGISIIKLAAFKEVRIYDPALTNIHDNHLENIRLHPSSAGRVYLNDGQISGPETHVGMIFNCYEPGDSLPGGVCNTTVSGYGYADKAGVNNKLSNNDRYGIVIRGPYSDNIIIEGNIIENNMLTTNSNNVICSSTDRDHIGGGIALTCGARPVIRNNIIRNNGAELRPMSEGSHSAINIWRGGKAQIYDNQIYSNKSDGISIVDTPISSFSAESPLIGLNGQPLNKIYNNGRFGISFAGNTKVDVSNNEIYQNARGGVGLYAVADTSLIYSNYIHDNVSINRAGGIGINSLQTGAVISISNNTITGNTVSGSGDTAGGIGIINPIGGTIYIDNNVIDANQAPSDSDVGGIGLSGASYETPGVLADVYITSNRISNHRYGNANQAAVAFKWLYVTSAINIRNNKKDGLGLSNNAIGVRFKELAAGTNVNIQDNLILNNISSMDSGGAGIEFKSNYYTNIYIDNNILSNCSFTNPSGDKAVISFQDSLLYSSNSIKLSRNRLNETNVHGMLFRSINGADASHVAKVFVGTPDEVPGMSNDFLIPAGKCAVAFKENTVNLGIGIYNNNNVQGGISVPSNNLYYLTIKGNTSIYDGKGSIDEALGQYDAGIQMYNVGAGPIRGSSSNPVPITIESNGIRNNNDSGILLESPSGIFDLSLINNIIASNGCCGTNRKRNGFQSDDLDKIRHFLVTGNTFRYNGYDSTNPKECSGMTFKNTSVSLTVTNNYFYENRGSGIASSSQYTAANSIFYNNMFYKNGLVGAAIKFATRIYHCTFAYNGTRGATKDKGLQTDRNTIIINSIFWGNTGAAFKTNPTSVTYCDVQGGYSGTGNIEIDPVFVNDVTPPYDFHLASDSPCKDAGTGVGVYSDIDDDSRPYNGSYDMGADEYTP